MGRQSNKAIERILKIGSMTEAEAYEFLRSEKSATVLELGHAKSNDAHCLACGFQMLGGADVGLCPKCGSDRWYRTRLSPNDQGHARRPTMTTADTQSVVTPTDSSNGEAGRLCVQRLVRGHLSATLYLADCMDVLPTLSGVDAVVMDPPYGYSYETNHVAETTTAKWMRKPIMGDEDTSLRDSVIAWAEGLPWLAFGAWRMPKPQGVRGVLVWDKGPASGMGDLSFPWKGSWEEIYVGGKGWAGKRDEGVIKDHWIVTRASMGRTHPNEKPVSLMGVLVEKLPPGCTVLDPFMGSGTTGIACLRTGRNFIGIEKDPEHFATAVSRLEREVNQGVLL